MKRKSYCFIVIIASLLVVSFLVFKKEKVSYRNTIWVADRELSAQIVEAASDREKGLSGRESLCATCGMLFIFDRPGFYAFWMKDMLFDIDILWIAGNRVVDITFDAKVPPKEELSFPKTTYQSKSQINKVLEVNAGWVEKNGIEIGDTVKY